LRRKKEDKGERALDRGCMGTGLQYSYNEELKIAVMNIFLEAIFLVVVPLTVNPVVFLFKTS